MDPKRQKSVSRMKKDLKTILGTTFLVVAVNAVASSINTGNGIAGFRFPIYGPEPSNPYVQITGNSLLSQPGGSTVYNGGLLSGSRYVMEFWIGPESATSFNDLTLVRTAPFRSAPATPNDLPNGLVFPESAIGLALPAGSPAKLAVRVWDTLSGPDFGSATVRGQGNLFTSGPLGGVAPDNSLFLNPNWVGESFSLVIVPEPSSIALAGLGAATVLIFRRWK